MHSNIAVHTGGFMSLVVEKYICCDFNLAKECSRVNLGSENGSHNTSRSQILKDFAGLGWRVVDGKDMCYECGKVYDKTNAL